MAGFERADVGKRPQKERAPGERLTLVTGGTGAVGPFMVNALLDSGRQVVVYDLKDLRDEGKFVLGSRLGEVPIEIGSIDDQARFFDVVKEYKPTEIAHMAMIIDPGVLARNRMTGFHVDVEGTINVLEAMLHFDVERLVYFSSIGVLPIVQYEPIDAAHPILLPTSGPGTDFYGAFKASGEAICFAYHQALGVDFRTIRPSAVYGLGMTIYPGPIKQMVEGSVRGEKLRFETGGRHPRSYTNSIDVAELVVAMLDARDDADRIFYGATGEKLVTTTEVAEIVMELVPGADIEIGEELSQAEESIVGLRGQLSIDNAKEQLGWKPRYGDLKEGIKQYVDQYRAFYETYGS